MEKSTKKRVVRKSNKPDLLEQLKKINDDKVINDKQIDVLNEDLDEDSKKVIKKTDIGSKKIIQIKKNDDEENKIEQEKVNTIDKYIDKKKEVKVIGKTVEKVLKVTTVTKLQVETKTIKTVNHEDIEYKGKHYTVCLTHYNDDHILFVIDSDDKDKIINIAWHFKPIGGYIAHTYYTQDENAKKELYLHNVIMNKLTFEGKGQQQTVDHINRIGRDNRKCNLRMAESQSAQNFNQKRRERTTELPEDSGLTVDDMPKNVYYAKPNGPHGEYFYIEIKGVQELGDRFLWKSTKSNKISLKIKLQETIDKIKELREQYPILKEIFVTEDTEELRNQLITEYNEIIQLSHYPADVILNNIFTFEAELHNKQEIKKDDEIIILETTKKLREYGRKADLLPKDCGVLIDDIPKYCYYKPASEKRGDKFIIERHPELIKQNKRQWATSESKSLTTLDKFNLMINKLNELNNQ
jgi:hypothetical protein